MQFSIILFWLAIFLTKNACGFDAHSVRLPDCYSQAKDLGAPRELSEFEDSIKGLVASGKLPSVSVIVIRQGTVVWDRSYGWADKENKILASTDTMYAVGSVSKAFTGLAIAALISRGTINESKPASQYLKSIKLRSYVGMPTVNQLISMQAGIPHGWEYSEAPKVPADEWAQNVIVAYSPGSQFVYSNITYGLLGRIVSDVTGEPLNTAVTKLAFAPLGMDHTFLYPQSTTGLLAVGYSRSGRLPGYRIAPEGAAGFSSSPRDLARLGMFRAGIKGCSLPSIDRAASRKLWRKSGYAFGWAHLNVPKGRDAFLSNGEVQGGRADILVVPKDKTVIVVTENSHSGSPSSDELTFAIAEKLMPGFLGLLEEQGKHFEFHQPLSVKPLSGEWFGSIAVGETDVHVMLQLSEGKASVRVAGEESQDVRNLIFTEEGLQGAVDLAIPITIPWLQGRSYLTNFRLIPVENVMRGVLFVQSSDKKPGIGLPFYLHLQRKP